MNHRESDQQNPATAPQNGPVEEIVEALRTDIIEGRFRPDAKLRQELLAERFGVSRMPVREALGRLEAEGLVVSRPNRSVRVAPLNVADMIEIFEMRVAAETLALRLAIPHLSNAQIEKASEIQQSLETAPIEKFGLLNSQFHRMLYEPCAKPRLLSHIETLATAADRYLRITIAAIDYADKSHREHHALLEACHARDEAAAINCLASHIGDAADVLSIKMRRAEDPND